MYIYDHIMSLRRAHSNHLSNHLSQGKISEVHGEIFDIKLDDYLSAATGNIRYRTYSVCSKKRKKLEYY